MDTAALQFCACSEGRVGGLLAVPRAAPRHRLGLQYGDTDRRLELDLVTLRNTRAYIRSSVAVGGLPAFLQPAVPRHGDPAQQDRVNTGSYYLYLKMNVMTFIVMRECDNGRVD